MEEHTGHVGVLMVSSRREPNGLHIPQAQSLKDKRMVVRSIKDKVWARYNVSVAELDGQDKWQTATLGFAAIIELPSIKQNSKSPNTVDKVNGRFGVGGMEKLNNHDRHYLDGQLNDILTSIERHAAGAFVCEHKIEFH